MAGERHEIDLSAVATLSPWPLVFEIAEATTAGSWVLVGGLMVRLHEFRAGLVPARATRDVDMVVDVRAPAVDVGALSVTIRGLGFEARVPERAGQPLHRFERGDDQIDLMVPDHLPPRPPARLMHHPAFAVDAGHQALSRRDTFVIRTGDDMVEVASPDVVGALVMKGAAHLVDSRDGGRHLEDAAVLFASVERVGDLDFDPAIFSKTSRKRLRHLVENLRDEMHPGWAVLDPESRARGLQRLLFIERAALQP